MRSWLLVLTVLATFHTFSRVAGSQEVRIPPARPDSYSIFLDSTTTTKTTESANAESSSSQVVNKLRSSDISSVKESVENEISNEVTDDREEYEEVTVRRKPNAEQLVEIEKNLLSMFGFKKRPQIDRSKVVIPEAMRRLYEQIMGHELDTPKSGLHTKNANTVRSFTHEETDIDRRFQHHHRFRLHFNVSSIPQGDELRAAELVLSRKAHLEGEKLRHHVLVYDIVRPGIKGRRDPLMTLVDAKSVKISENGTITLDVMPAVARWLKVPRHNHGLLIHVSSMDANLTSVPEHRHIRLRRSVEDSATTEGETEGWQQQQPLLMTYTDDGRHKPRPARDANSGMPPRSRRAPGRKGKRPLRICQRHPLYVDFSDVGWSDWIVAPPGYDAHYCAGECTFPIADHLNTTNHAIVQTLVNSINPNTVPKACCVPTHLSSICMLYLDDQNKVVLKNYQDMTVIGCGCR